MATQNKLKFHCTIVITDQLTLKASEFEREASVMDIINLLFEFEQLSQNGFDVYLEVDRIV